MKIKLLFLTLLLMCFAAGCSYVSADTDPEDDEDPVIEEQDPVESEDRDPVKVTYVVITGDPASYSVYEITEDTFRHYDYTKYWLEKNSYDFFSDPRPEGDEYLVRELPVTADEWESIDTALTINHFFRLPEKVEAPEGTYDAASIYIEVETEDRTYRSGGYGAGIGEDRDNIKFDRMKRFMQLVISLLENDPGESVLPTDLPPDESLVDTWYSSDGSVYVMYVYNSDETFIVDGDEFIPVDISMGAYGPKIEKIDVDGDGEEEYVIADCEGSGTGVSLYGLTIVGRTDDGYKIVEYGADYFSNILDEEIGYNYYEDTGEVHVFEILPPWFDRHEGCTVQLDRKTSLQDIVWSDIISFRFEDGRVYMYAPTGYVYEDSPVPDYTDAVIAEAELGFDEDYKVGTRIWSIYPDEDSDF